MRCGISVKNAAGLKIHERFCKGQPEVEPDKAYKCKSCKLSFDTQSGLSQHKRAKHQEIRDKERSARNEGRKKGRRRELVTELKLERIRELSREYRNERHINKKVQENFPHLTVRQISDLRRRIDAKSSSPTSSEAEGEYEGEDSQAITNRSSSSSSDDNFEDAVEEVLQDITEPLIKEIPGVAYKEGIRLEIEKKADPEIGLDWGVIHGMIVAAAEIGCIREHLDLMYEEVDRTIITKHGANERANSGKSKWETARTLGGPRDLKESDIFTHVAKNSIISAPKN